MLDASGTVVMANPAAARMLGIADEELRGCKVSDLAVRAIREDSSPFPFEEHPALGTLRTGQPQAEVLMGVPQPDESLRWLLINTWPLFRSGQPHPYAAVATFTDVTARKQKEEALQESERRMRSLFENTQDAIFLISLDGVHLAANQQAADMLGYSVDELIGLKTTEVVAPDEHADTIQVREALLASGSVPLYTRTFRRRNGEEFPVEVNVSLVRDAAGRPLYVQSIARDITARRRAEQQLRESEERYRLLAEHATDMIARYDPAGVFLFVSPACESLLGYKSADLVGRSIYDLFDPDQVADLVEQHRAILANTGTHTIRYRLRTRAQGYIWVESTATAIRDPDTGEAIEIVAATRDITARHRAEQALRESEERYRELFTEASLRAQELALLQRVQSAVASELDLDALLRTIVEAIAETYGYTLVSLYLLDGDVLRLQHQVGYERFITEIPITMGVSGRAIRTGQALLIEDVRTDPAFLGAVANITSEVAVPLFDEGRVVGLLNVESVQGVTLGEDDLRVMRELGQQASLAISRARVYTAARQELAERRRAEEALRESEERFRQLAENVRDVFWLADPATGRLLYINPAYEKIWGRSCQDLYDDPLSFLQGVHPDDRQRVREGQPRQMDGTYDEEYRVVRPDGSVRWVRARAFPVYNEQGRPYRVVGTAEDITRQKQVADALAESERRYRELVEGASDIVFAVDLRGRFTYVNPAGLRLTGYQIDEVLGRHFTDLIAPEWRVSVSDFYRAQLRRRVPETRTEIPILTRGGEECWLEQTVTLITEEGRPVGVQSIARDVSERRRAEQAEQEQRHLAEVLRDSIAALSRSLDLDIVLERILTNLRRVVQAELTNIVLIDSASGKGHIARQRGYAELGLLGAIPPGPVAIGELEIFAEMFRTGQPIVVPDRTIDPRWRLPDPVGLRAYVGVPIRSEGRVIGFLNLDSLEPGAFSERDAERLLVFADQAAIAIRNAQLYEAAERNLRELTERNNELDAFSYTVAHDLRAPLGIIVGYLHLLMEMDLPPDVRSIVQTLEDRAAHMAEIIGALLQLAEIRHTSEVIAATQMRPLVEQAIARAEDIITDRGVSVSIEGDLPPAMGYSPWLEEVFANLISNAVKYIGKDNPDPRVVVRGTQHGAVVRYEVQDNGLGIKPEDQSHLFEMFTRFHRHEGSGSGLGLPIVRRIITRLHGELGVQSTPGEGTVFWFTLPAVES